jgi:hypothetical protein
MYFHIRIDRQISLRQLASLQQSGAAVLKTPHIGNLGMSELAVGSLGILLLLVDATVGEMDFIYHPHCVIRRGQREELAHPQMLSTATSALHPSKLAPEFFKPGSRMMDGHMAAVRQAVPGARVELHSAWMQYRTDRLRDMLEVCADSHPDLWERFVDSTGIARRVPAAKGWSQISSIGIHRLDGEQGWVVPNVINILADAVFGTFEYGGREVWSLSGLQMAGYIERHSLLLDALYAAVRRQLALPLPEHVTYTVVPVAECRFAVPANRRAALDEVVDVYSRWQQHQEHRGTVMRSLPERRLTHKQAVQMLDLEKNGLLHELRDAAMQSGIVYDVRDANFPTQYDVLDGGGLYVAEWMMDRPVNDVTNAYRLVRKALKR